jgi:ATP synthase protein I
MKKKKSTLEFLEIIKKKEQRKLLSQKHTKNWIFWIGFSIFGLIGWSVILPTAFGLGLGIWIDHRWPSNLSWTLILGMGGLVLGCLSAWIWVVKESKEIERKRNDRK